MFDNWWSLVDLLLCTFVIPVVFIRQRERVLFVESGLGCRQRQTAMVVCDSFL